MSHEIRTPLNSIIGLSQVLLKKSTLSSSDISQHHLESIHASGKNLMKLLNNILDLSKIEAGHMELVQVNFQLEEWLQSLSAIYGASAEVKGLIFTQFISPNVPQRIYTDREKLGQVLLNLLDNAIKFTPRGKKIRLEVDYQEELLAFHIIDEGIGISEIDQKKIFEKFEQLDGSPGRLYPGVGLGLAISKQIVHLLGGSLDVNSTPGKGSIFSVKIPLANVQIDHKQNRLFKMPNQLDSFSEDAVVLVVEDNPTNQETFVALFSALGVSIHLASNGQESIEQAKKLTPDLIFMDLHMPGMSGIEAMQEIRKQESCQQIPIIILSADAFLEKQENALAKGASGYLTKPVELLKLQATLATYLQSGTS
ncbi:signal transduction histidine-protein kinase BarA-like [Ylistrum balloti]|uniref:signal transduction histidine-protein kinase BarA-like n=1 Tax=Ylistrum balloti TaxID=509963 RepID=UPI0029059C1B|nr:signal transduction histidine-protein kinase BarA-like [Ylistrum balloti]